MGCCGFTREVTGDHVTSYEEYNDELDGDGSLRAGGHINASAQVCKAIKSQLSPLGQDRPVYNKILNR
jgi:hypothetical protein